MSALLAEISWLFASDDISRGIGLVVWTGVCLVLTPSFWRCIKKRPHYLDPLFAVSLIMALNRVAFGVQSFVHNDTLADWSRWTGIAAGAFFGFVVFSYQKADRV